MYKALKITFWKSWKVLKAFKYLLLQRLILKRLTNTVTYLTFQGTTLKIKRGPKGSEGGVAVYTQSHLKRKRRVNTEKDGVEGIYIEFFHLKRKVSLFSLFSFLRKYLTNYPLTSALPWVFKSIQQLYGFRQLIRSAAQISEESETLGHIIAICNCRNVNKVWSIMKEILTVALYKLAPQISKRVHSKSSPWLPAVK